MFGGIGKGRPAHSRMRSVENTLSGEAFSKPQSPKLTCGPDIPYVILFYFPLLLSLATHQAHSSFSTKLLRAQLLRLGSSITSCHLPAPRCSSLRPMAGADGSLGRVLKINYCSMQDVLWDKKLLVPTALLLLPWGPGLGHLGCIPPEQLIYTYFMVTHWCTLEVYRCTAYVRDGIRTLNVQLALPALRD